MINEGVCVDCPGKLRLVPYLPCHVPRYHAWMCEPELLAATESEPLTLEEEHENQDSWLHSREKLTFILTVPRGALTGRACEKAVLHPVDPSASPYKHVSTETPPTGGAHEVASCLPLRYTPSGVIDAFSKAPEPGTADVDELARQGFVMVGDCNLFLLDAEELEGEMSANTDATAPLPSQRRVFEVEVMVAEKTLRRTGLAQLAVRMIMQYAVAVLSATHFVAKILDDNMSSIALFADKLRFKEYKRVKVFHEVHLVRSLSTPEERAAWKDECRDSLYFAPFTAKMKEDTFSF